MMSENTKGYLAAISANVLFGLNISLTKSFFASSWMTPACLLFIRISASTVMFWVIDSFGEREKVKLRDLPTMAAMGFIGLAFTQLAFNYAINLCTPTTLSLISSLNPIIVLLLSAFFLKEIITPKKATGVIIGVTGVLILIIQNRNAGPFSSSGLGIMIATLSAISFASYAVILRGISGKYQPLTIMKWMYLMAVFFIAPLGIPELPKQRLFTSEVTLLAVFQLGYSVFLASMLGFFLMSVALKRIKASTTSMFSNLQALTTAIAAIIVGQDIFTWDKPLAMILIISGVLLVTQTEYGKYNRRVIK